ncbi:Ktr system potassium uptake protein B [Anaerohalosphaera lusitana]|uniref:Ktr system potassium uptake protein B n=1 Tax=Anaerohalosphaera lusitana TaxID=1936003 RepID=A0A1U9NHC3_9BACT|nr:TrkH family potassium uptake protein [Anaerohalosphaera lusitana]AQT67167.1 Ktr system potassium uptake protein B [Anaerohalosphaera lusitana]
MKITYKNKTLEWALIALTAVTAAAVVASFVLHYGFREPMIPTRIVNIIHITALLAFLTEKILRLHNAASKREYLRANFFEVPLLVALLIAVLGAGRWFALENPNHVRTLALSIYLVCQVIAKACRGSVNVASSGKNPTIALIAIFVILILAGAGILMLPRSYNSAEMSFTDSVFTATSATCVTGLIVKDTGSDFTLMGQITILTLIQLGGLGIVIFGAVIALLLGQALTVRESVAMRDLLNAQTLGRIGNIIAFIFAFTLIIEAIGAASLFHLWQPVPGHNENIHQQWFYSIFHSISAFCNAGFSLSRTSLIPYANNPAVHLVIAPLIILGGLGFTVLYNIFDVAADRIKHLYLRIREPNNMFRSQLPKRISLQTKIVLTTSLALIIAGAVLILVLENNGPQSHTHALAPDAPHSLLPKTLSALFQSVTARTAGFNTVDIANLTPASKTTLIILMLIGGSPGSTAGGIKTVTFALLLGVLYANFRKRSEVEIFKRSISITIIGRAITVTMVFAIVLITAVLALSITESHSTFTQSDINFEAASALGTVGLSTGITADLSTAGKWIIIALMLIGRLGPLTLLTAMTFNIRPRRYNYPTEPVIVG